MSQTKCPITIIKQIFTLTNIDKNIVLIDNKIEGTFFTYINSLAQSIAHILDNAKDACSDKVDGKILIKAYSDDENEYNIFEITNIGKHIPKNIMHNMFTPYFSTKEQRNGVGLSLYNCKTIIELHLKGSVEAFNLTSSDISNNQDAVMFKISLPKK